MPAHVEPVRRARIAVRHHAAEPPSASRCAWRSLMLVWRCWLSGDSHHGVYSWKLQ